MCPHEPPRVRRFYRPLLTGLIIALTGPSALAQADDDSFKPEIGAGGAIVWHLFESSWVINSIILLLSIVALMLFIYFMLTIKSRLMAPPQFLNELNKLVQKQDFERAADYCRDHQNTFIASIVQRCVENTSKPHSVIMEMIETEGRRRADIVWNRISYLADVSNVAPMLGLLGTVWGMIRAFFWGLPEGSASISSALLSRAIGGAMATTLFGLIVGIVALVFHSVVKGRLTRALAEAEQAIHSIADHIKRGET